MRIHKPFEVIRYVEVERLCNRCGKTIVVSPEFYVNYVNRDITGIEVMFGYGSKFDTETWRFDLCDDCLTAIIEVFKFPPTISHNSL